jgi:hypothetical protein
VAANFCECAMVCVYGLMDRFVLTTRAFGEASSYPDDVRGCEVRA